jgi:hypothetical protein
VKSFFFFFFFFIENQKVVLFPKLRKNSWEAVASALSAHKKESQIIGVNLEYKHKRKSAFYFFKQAGDMCLALATDSL